MVEVQCGNPWIFNKIRHYLENGEKLSNPSNSEKIKIIKKHIELAVEEKGEEIAIKELRKHISAYTKNMKNSSEFRGIINMIDTKNELVAKLEEYFKSI